jgi:hypothetical protein
MRNAVFAMMCLLLAVGISQAQGEKSDLEEYIETIRAWGMTETGRMQIRSVANLCAGATVLEYRKDDASRRYWPSYTSATCPKPDADPPEVERWKSMRMSEADRLVGGLREFADADGSGFVTTEEANDFRYLIEFGYLVAQVARDEGPGIDRVAQASGMEPADAQARLDAYQALANRITAAGVAELPQVVLGQ